MEKKLFLSHTAADGKIVKDLCHILEKRWNTSEIVFSSLAETGTHGGDELMPWINRNLEGSEIFVAVITENYLRSLYCMYELNLALYFYSKKQLSKLVPVCSNENVYKKVENLLSPYGLIYINASDPKEASNNFKYTLSSSEEFNDGQLQEVMTAIAKQRSDSPYIGCTNEEYGNYIRYCESQNIRKIQDQPLHINEIKCNLLKYDDIVILATTGIGVIRNLRENVFVDALLKGTNIHIIVANPWSDFCNDVACIEDPANGGRARLKPLSDEFGTVLGYLHEAYEAAKAKSGGNPIGSINCYCAYTLLRQTITMGHKDNGDAWCWLSMTMPPRRSNTKTPCLLIEGDTNNEELLISTVWRHCKGIMEIAKNRGDWFTISDIFRNQPFYLEKQSAQEYWDKKVDEAKQFMDDQREDFPDGFLIEVAAQHPLRGNKPGKEFEERLECAVQLYKKLKGAGDEDRVVNIYVPGSRHKYKGKADPVSLSEAGKAYLISKGIPEEDIFGEEKNNQYKGEDGVYNSADECYVASEVFKDGEYGCLYCICSPVQVMRKTLFYYEFGIEPQCISVPTKKMYHSVTAEMICSVPNVLYRDHNWQDKTSDPFRKSREERRP